MAKKLSDLDDDFLDELEDEIDVEEKGKRKRNIKRILITAILVIGVICALAVIIKAGMSQLFGGKKGVVASKKHIGISSLFEETKGSYPVICNGEVSDYRVYEFDGVRYLNRDFVVNNIDSRFYYDKETEAVLYTTADETYTFTFNNKYYEDSKGKKHDTEYPCLVKNSNGIYIALELISFKRTMFEYTVEEEPVRYCMWTYEAEGTYDNSMINEATALREGNSVTKDIYLDIDKGDFVTVLDDTDEEFDYVLYKGVKGYVLKSTVNPKNENYHTFVVNESFPSVKKDHAVKLGWTQVTNKDANAIILEHIDKTTGLNTISPTWYHVEDATGKVASLADKDITDGLHNRGYEVWPLVSDFVKDMDSYTLLSSRTARKNIIATLISEAKTYGFDGYNVDFEDITNESGESFLQFLREFSVECRKLGIVLSVDNYVPMEHTAFYNRPEQGKVVDYVVVMAYDEHYGGSQESGSVASLPFVKEGIKETVELVGDSSKVIAALPFYSRIWAEKSEDGSIKVTSKAYGMESMMQVINSNNAKVTWLEDMGQYYAEYQIDNVTYKAWLEDSKSMEAKLAAVNESNVGGVAFWRLGYEAKDIYYTINNYIK